jgi:hypothetical protein
MASTSARIVGGVVAPPSHKGRGRSRSKSRSRSRSRSKKY